MADREIAAGPGDFIAAPAGVPHGVVRADERTVVLMAMAPAPTSSSGETTRR